MYEGDRKGGMGDSKEENIKWEKTSNWGLLKKKQVHGCLWREGYSHLQAPGMCGKRECLVPVAASSPQGPGLADWGAS